MLSNPQKGEVHHSLLKDSDIAGNKRSLVDSLHEIPHIRTVLQLKMDFGGNVQLCKVSKARAIMYYFFLSV